MVWWSVWTATRKIVYVGDTRAKNESNLKLQTSGVKSNADWCQTLAISHKNPNLTFLVGPLFAHSFILGIFSFDILYTIFLEG